MPFQPSLRTASTAAAGLAVALLTAGPALAQAPADTADTTDTATTNVEISDPDDLVSDSAEQTLREETPKITLPEQVGEVSYIVFDDIDGNLNDHLLEWSAENRPELVPDGTDKGDSWANGQLIVAVSMGARENGVYCGDDVCAALDLFEGPHLDRTLEDMKPGLGSDGDAPNFTVAFLDAVRTAADPSLVTEDNSPSGATIAAIGGGIGAVVVGGGVWAYAYSRRKKTAEAKEHYDYVSREFGSVAQRLDHIDIRANSLTSPIADAELRRQWEEVRDEFLSLGDIVDKTGLTAKSTDAEFRAHHEELAGAAESVEHIENAEKNIERIFQMEHGDEARRREELTQLSEDIVSAQTETKDENLTTRLGALESEALELRDNLAAEDFMDRYADLLRSYGYLLELVKNSEMPELDEDTEGRHAPRIYDRDYRVGHGYAGWVPFVYMSSWHQADVQAAQSASGSGTNTSFSGGFSGGGGSSSF